jgi:hypothetical protein
MILDHCCHVTESLSNITKYSFGLQGFRVIFYLCQAWICRSWKLLNLLSGETLRFCDSANVNLDLVELVVSCGGFNYYESDGETPLMVAKRLEKGFIVKHFTVLAE